MQTSPIFNFRSDPVENGVQQTPLPESNSEIANTQIDEMQSDVSRLRRRLDGQEQEQQAYARRTKVLSMILGAFVVALAFALWFAYPTIGYWKNAASEISGLHGITGSLGQQMQSLDGKVQATNEALPGLSDRIDKLGTGMKSALQTARTQAQAAATQVGERIRADVNQSIQAIQSRMTGLESNQRETSGRVNELEGQIASLKHDLDSMRLESTNASTRLKQLQDEQQVREANLASLDEKIASHQSTIDALSNRIHSTRAEFALAKGRTQEISPGIFVTIKQLNTGQQQVDGSLRFASESRDVPIRAQGMGTPIVFYTSSDARPTQLVFTQVSKNQVLGYLLIPGQAAEDSPK